MRKVWLIVITLIILAVASGCSGGTPQGATPSDGGVTLWVTRDFGAAVFFNETVPLKGNETVLDVLSRHVQVETEYGGGFVNAINGLESAYTNFSGKDRQKRDWFYWLNGIQSNVGGGAYYPKAGDSIWWDYHNWQRLTYMPAVVGQYPQPFLSGFGDESTPTYVLHAGGRKDLAQQLEGFLKSQGVKELSVVPLENSLIFNRKQITLVLGTWQQLKTFPAIQDLIKNLNRTGIFVKPTDAGLVALDLNRVGAGIYEKGSAAIVATGTGQGDKTPLWLVIGVDGEGLERAVKLMTKQPQRLQLYAGVIVTPDDLVGVPVVK